MKLTKRLTALLLALVMVLAMAACGSVEPEHMTVRAALVDAPVTLDPARAVTETEKTVAANLFENLMKQTAAGVVNGQASGYDYVDNMDGTETYTFTLRNDLYWSDGRRVTAGDFVYSWRRLVDPQTNSPHASTLNMVAGYADALAGDTSALQVSAPDERTFVVTISGHCSYFIPVVCTAVCTMPVRADVTTVPDTADDSQTDSSQSDGEQTAQPLPDWSMDAATLLTNGAYSVSSLTVDTLTAAVADRYYDVRRLGPDQLEFHFADSTAAAMKLYDNEEVDFVLDAGDAPEAVEASSDKVSTVLVNQMASSLTETLRQAMSMVIDRSALAAAVGDAYRAADGLIPYGIVTSSGESFREVNGAVIDNDPDTYEARCEQAQALLHTIYSPMALSSMNTVTLVYTADSDGINARITQLLQTMWREKLGLRVALRGLSPEEMSQVLNSGEFSLALVDVAGDRNTALSYLNRFSSGQQGNYGQLYSNAYDMLIRVASNSSSDEARDAYLEDAERMLLDSGYVMPLSNETYTWLLRDTLTGLQTDGMGVYYFQGVVKVSS